jgi:DNA-binding protein YbaB
MSSLQSQLDQLMADFERTTKAIEQTRRRLGESSYTKRSKNRMVSVTVDSKGDLTGLKFHNTAYRNMAPAELEQALLALITETRNAAHAEAQKSLSGFMPEQSAVLTSLCSGKELTMEQIFGELEQAFAWGKRNTSGSGPEDPPKADRDETTDGWTGTRA